MTRSKLAPKIPLPMDRSPNPTTCLIPGPVRPMIPNGILRRYTQRACSMARCRASVELIVVAVIEWNHCWFYLQQQFYKDVGLVLVWFQTVRRVVLTVKISQRREPKTTRRRARGACPAIRSTPTKPALVSTQQ